MTDNPTNPPEQSQTPQSPAPQQASQPPKTDGTQARVQPVLPQPVAIPPHVLAQLLAANRRPGVVMPQMMMPMMQSQQLMQWQAPYPPPDAVERYEKVLPGTLNRLITMAEQNQAAQISDNRLIIEYTQKDQRRGHYLGVGTTILAMIGALVCVYMGQPWVAVAFLGVPVMAVARSLVEAAKANPEQAAPTVPTDTSPSQQPTPPIK